MFHEGGIIMFCKNVLNRCLTGENIRNSILLSGYTYDKIAEFLELSTSRVIYEWVNGKKLPSLENLARLSQIFNINVEDILFIENVF